MTGSYEVLRLDGSGQDRSGLCNIREDVSIHTEPLTTKTYEHTHLRHGTSVIVYMYIVKIPDRDEKVKGLQWRYV